MSELAQIRNNGYLARQEIDAIKNHWFQEDPLRLEPYGNKVFSQADEDGIIEEKDKKINDLKGKLKGVMAAFVLSTISLILSLAL